MRFVVYDQKGEMFEVPASVAKHLIINLGWSPTKVKCDASDLPLFQTPSAYISPEG